MWIHGMIASVTANSGLQLVRVVTNIHVHYVQSHFNPTLCPAVTLALSFHVCSSEYTELQPLDWLISSQLALMSHQMLKSEVVKELKLPACSCCIF